MIFNEIKSHVNTSLGRVGGMHPSLCLRLPICRSLSGQEIHDIRTVL